MAANEAGLIQGFGPAEQAKEMNEMLGISRQLYAQKIPDYFGEKGIPQVAHQNDLQKRAMQMAGTSSNYYPRIQRAVGHINEARNRYPDQYQRYMDPYENSVVQGSMRDMNRNFTENVLPSIEAHFIRRGQHGSSKQREMASRALRDMQAEMFSKAGQLRSHGYEIGGRQHAVDQERFGRLAELESTLGKQMQAQQLAEIEKMQNVGSSQQQHEQNIINSGYENWLRGQAAPWERLQMRHSILRGLPFGTSELRQFASPAQPQLNNAGKLGSLAMALLGMRHRGGE